MYHDTTARVVRPFPCLDLDTREVQLLLCVGGEGALVLLEEVVHEGVPAVEDRVSHVGGGISHHGERFLSKPNVVTVSEGNS